jgi:hypothetical protein
MANDHLHSLFDWKAHAEAVATDIFGPCDEALSQRCEDLRFGDRGSISVDCATGEWFFVGAYENEYGGTIQDLIRVYKEIDDRDVAIAYARQCRENLKQLNARGRGESPPGSAPSDILALRLKLFKNGFDPVIATGKIPVMDQWQLLPLTAESLREWTSKHPSAINTGVRAKNAPALDIDIMHQEAAKAADGCAVSEAETRVRRARGPGRQAAEDRDTGRRSTVCCSWHPP